MIMRELFAIIIIPTDFEKKLLNGKDVTVPVFSDATNRLASGQIQQELMLAYQQLLDSYNGRILQNAGFSVEQSRILLKKANPRRNHSKCITQGKFCCNYFPGLISHVITTLA